MVLIVAGGVDFVLLNFSARARFHPQNSEKEAARAIVEVIEKACLNLRYHCWLCRSCFLKKMTVFYLRTYSYDVLQDLQQKIYYHKKADQ